MESLNFEGTWLLRNGKKKTIKKLPKEGKLYEGNYYREAKEGPEVEDLFWDGEGNAFEGLTNFYKYYDDEKDGRHYNRNMEFDLMERISSKFSKERIE